MVSRISKSDKKSPQESNVQVDDDSENYVQKTMRKSKHRPFISWSNWWNEVDWSHVFLLLVPHSISLYTVLTVKLRWETAAFAFVYYIITGMSITAGYHRLWAHRAYNASKPLQWFFALAGSAAGQRSILWWAVRHRAHHRYTDTDLDPYGAHRGLFYSHIGWLLTKCRYPQGVADISDLKANPIVQWQEKWCQLLEPLFGFGFPALVAGALWGDWMGGVGYAGGVRMIVVLHSTFCVNSLAHYLGSTPYDDKHTPRDHVFTALMTFGEGYHNFHHEFPMDYRNAIRWYQYDPTKWFLWICRKVGLASHLKTFPDNEIRKGELAMKLKELYRIQEGTQQPISNADLPILSWKEYVEQSKSRALIAIGGYIHDVGAGSFMDEHPGGRRHLENRIGSDATSQFFGGVYEHSNAAHNLLAMKRVGILSGGQPHANELRETNSVESSNMQLGDQDSNLMIAPCQRFAIVEYNGLR